MATSKATQPVMRAAGYVRVSTAKQADKGLSLDEQRRRVVAYADSQAWPLELFIERGVSGRGDDRPQLNELRDRRGEFDKLIVPKLDRLGRNFTDLAALKGQLDDAGIELVCLDPQIDFGTPVGKLVWANLTAVGEFESHAIGERVAAVTEARARSGKIPGGPDRYGYDRIDGEHAPNEIEAPILLRMFEEYDAGRSDKEICRALNADGVKTKRGHAWTPASVSRCLRDPTYMGKVRLKGKTYDGKHPALVSVALWERVAAKRAKTPPRKGRTTSRGQHLFVRGLLRCGHCGSAMGSRSYRKTGSDEVREQYICLGRDSHGLGSCPQTPVPREPIDSAVLAYFNDRCLDIEASKRRFADSLERARDDAQALRLEAEREERQLADALDRLDRDYVETKISAERFEAKSAKFEAEHAAAAAHAERMRKRERELTDGSVFHDAESTTLARLAELQQAIAGEVAGAPDVKAQRAILSQMFERFVIGRFDQDRSGLPESERELAGHFAAQIDAADIEADPDILQAGEYIVIPFERPEAIEGFDEEWRPAFKRAAMPFVHQTG